MTDIIVPGHMIQDKRTKKIKGVADIHLKCDALIANVKKLGNYIEHLEKFTVDNVDWDQLRPKDYEFCQLLHKKYYPENYTDVPTDKG